MSLRKRVSPVKTASPTTWHMQAGVWPGVGMDCTGRGKQGDANHSGTKEQRAAYHTLDVAQRPFLVGLNQPVPLQGKEQCRLDIQKLVTQTTLS